MIIVVFFAITSILCRYRTKKKKENMRIMRGRNKGFRIFAIKCQFMTDFDALSLVPFYCHVFCVRSQSEWDTVVWYV